MRLDQWIGREWYGNSPRAWTIALVVLVVVYLLLIAARGLFVRRLGAIAERTATDIDDLFVAVAKKTRGYFLFVVALLIATRSLDLSRDLHHWIGIATAVVALLQVGTWANALIGAWIDRYIERRRAAQDVGSVTTVRALGYGGRGLVWALLFAMALRVFGFDVTALVTGLGVGGIAIALAVQNILGDLFAALAIVVDKPFVIGDVIMVEPHVGSVEHIGLKTTRLRSISGEQIIISNGELLKSRIRNFKRMYERRMVFTLDVAYETPADVVGELPAVIQGIVEAQSPVRFDRSHFTTFTDSSLRIETVYYVLDPDYTKGNNIQQAINLEIMRQFAARGVSFAYPTRTVVLRNPLGASPAAV